MLAVGSDDTSAILTEKVMIYEYSDANRRWLKMDAISFMSDPVHDIAFAPNIGRSYSVLAVASKELKIVTLKPNKNSQNGQKSSDKYDVGIFTPSVRLYQLLHLSGPQAQVPHVHIRIFEHLYFIDTTRWLF